MMIRHYLVGLLVAALLGGMLYCGFKSEHNRAGSIHNPTISKVLSNNVGAGALAAQMSPEHTTQLPKKDTVRATLFTPAAQPPTGSINTTAAAVSRLRPSTPPPPALVAANNAFGFHLYAELARENDQENLFLSPVSIEFCLAMAANGAAGETYAQLAQTLGWGTMSPSMVNAGFQTLSNRLLSADPQVHVSLADSLWLNKPLAFKSDYRQANRQYFGATLSSVDFTDPNTVPLMNAWVKENTHGMITDVVSKQALQGAVMVLSNALYFKGEWQLPLNRNSLLTTPSYSRMAANTP